LSNVLLVGECCGVTQLHLHRPGPARHERGGPTSLLSRPKGKVSSATPYNRRIGGVRSRASRRGMTVYAFGES
jgi:hypothetical protein